MNPDTLIGDVGVSIGMVTAVPHNQTGLLKRGWGLVSEAEICKTCFLLFQSLRWVRCLHIEAAPAPTGWDIISKGS